LLGRLVAKLGVGRRRDDVRRLQVAMHDPLLVRSNGEKGAERTWVPSDPTREVTECCTLLVMSSPAKLAQIQGSSDLAKLPHARYDSSMTGRAHKLLEDALTLPDDERLDLAEQLLSSLPSDPEWLAELERRARRALADPNGGEAWDVVERRLAARVASR